MGLRAVGEADRRVVARLAGRWQPVGGLIGEHHGRRGRRWRSRRRRLGGGRLGVTPVPFLVTGSRMNGVTGGKKPVPMTVWGLWQRVPARPLGEHHLRAVGGDGHRVTVDVSYRFVVAPQAARLVRPARPGYSGR